MLRVFSSLKFEVCKWKSIYIISICILKMMFKFNTKKRNTGKITATWKTEEEIIKREKMLVRNEEWACEWISCHICNNVHGITLVFVNCLLFSGLTFIQIFNCRPNHIFFLNNINSTFCFWSGISSNCDWTSLSSFCHISNLYVLCFLLLLHHHHLLDQNYPADVLF